MDSDDEVPQNEPGTSSNIQPPIPVLPSSPVRINIQFARSIDQYYFDQFTQTSTSTSSEDESTDNVDEHGEGECGPAIQSTRSHDSRRTVLYPDLHVLINDEHWTMNARSTQVCSRSRVILFRDHGKRRTTGYPQLDHCTGCAAIIVLDEVIEDSSSIRVEFANGVGNQTRDVLERCMATCGKAAGARAKKKSRARKEAPAQEVRGYYKQFAEAKHLEWKSWADNKVFDLVDMRKFKPKNCVTGRWVLTIKTDKQGNFLGAKARWVLRGFQDKQKDYLQTDSPASTRPGFRMSCQMASSKSWDLFHIDLKTAVLEGQSQKQVIHHKLWQD